MLTKIIRRTLLACGIALSLTGCAIEQRAERFVHSYESSFTEEYTQRSDPNILTSPKYAALQKFGELQRQVTSHQLDPYSARKLLEIEDYENAFDAVQSIARSSLQDAFRNSNPEVEVVQNLPSIGTKALTEDHISDTFTPRFSMSTTLSDILNPSVNLNASVSKRIEFEPSIHLGRMYSISYSTKNETFEHDIKYRYNRWMIKTQIEHNRDQILQISNSITYFINKHTSINTQHSYDFITKDNTFNIGIAGNF